jgi:hypothetical protein
VTGYYDHSTQTYVYAFISDTSHGLSSDPARGHVTTPPVTFKSLLLPADIWQADTSERTMDQCPARKMTATFLSATYTARGTEFRSSW